MSKLSEAYIAERLAESDAAATRAARVKEFVAEHDPEIISDLFTVIRDAIVENGVKKSSEVMEQHKLAASVVFAVECDFLGLL